MYYPSLKTTDSELRALRNLDDKTKSAITPVFELTRSRKTTKFPEGSLPRRAEQVVEFFGERSCIIDLSTEDGLINHETYSLFDEKSGYSKWISFLTTHFHSKITPCVLFDDEGSEANFKQQVSELAGRYERICIRTSVTDELAEKLYRWTRDVIDPQRVILCPLLYYIEPSSYGIVKQKCIDYINGVVGNALPFSIIFTGSSFPRFVTQLPNCTDTEGSVELNELKLERELQTLFPNHPIDRADCASVHPQRYPTKGGSWVPRIDYQDNGRLQYARFRLGEGGYIAAASRVSASVINAMPESWAKAQMSLAKSKTPAGLSPSFWISVRINDWITRRALQY